MRKTYRGERIEVSFDLARCIHIGECLRELPEVFELERRPWILPDAAEPDEVAGAVLHCPSGALQFRRLDGGPSETHEATTVTPIRNGPLLVTGDISVTDEDGTVEHLPRATLCRCGASERKPFCDNSHIGIRFRAEGRPFRIHVSRVRPAILEPISAEEDPRRDG